MKKEPSELNLFRRALRIAAVEAYIMEIEDLNIPETDRNTWIQERMDSWLESADLLITRDETRKPKK